jgi:hypothetical protein
MLGENSTSTKKITVTLNLVQGPSYLYGSALAARWMLKQVQHDKLGMFLAR